MEEFKILCIGDPHIKESSVIETQILGDKIVETINAEHPEIVVVMGDTLHNHEKINCTIQVMAVKFFERILEASPDLKLYVIIGNHDIPNPHEFLPDTHAFYSLKGRDRRLVIVDKPVIAKHRWCNFLFVPFVPPGRFREACELVIPFEEVPEKISTIFCHQEFNGIMMENHSPANDSENYPSDFPLCVAGHIHKYQVVGDNLFYTGTPYQHRFGEDTDKALLCLDFAGDEITPKRVFVSGIPLKKSFTVSKDEFMDLEVNQTDNYKIEVYGYEGEITSLKLSEKHSSLKKMKNVKILYSVMSERAAHEEKLKDIVSLSFKQRLEDLVKGQNDPVKLKMHEMICKKV